MKISKKAKSQSSYKKGDTVAMLFHLIGLVSEENHFVDVSHKDGTITLDNNYRFDTKTGECLNDNIALGARRTLKINSPIDIESPRCDNNKNDGCQEEDF
jgi:hypothetical protein